MVYLYYWDGKLKEAPHKYPDSTGIVRELNKWTHKIDAKNGMTNNLNRYKKLKELNTKSKEDFHILTNNINLMVQCSHGFEYDKEHKTWVEFNY